MWSWIQEGREGITGGRGRFVNDVNKLLAYKFSKINRSFWRETIPINSNEKPWCEAPVAEPCPCGSY